MQRSLIALSTLATLGLLSAPALAEKRTSPSDKKVHKDRFGEAFDIGPRHTALPAGEEPARALRAHGLSDGPVSVVLKAHLAEVEYCWNKLPFAARRADTMAVLRLTVEASGKVSAVEVAGELPAGTPKCIATAANRWTFPTAEIQSQVETAVALRAL